MNQGRRAAPAKSAPFAAQRVVPVANGAKAVRRPVVDHPMALIDASVFFKLARVVNLTARPFTAGLGRAHGLSLNEWRVLLVLSGHPGIAATEIAHLCGLDKMSVSRAVSALERQGRLDKQRDLADRRRTQLRLSRAGRALVAEILPLAQVREQQLLSGLSAAQQRQLASWLDRLAERMLVAEQGQG